jgi:hypothetical protein
MVNPLTQTQTYPIFAHLISVSAQLLLCTITQSPQSFIYFILNCLNSLRMLFEIGVFVISRLTIF